MDWLNDRKNLPLIASICVVVVLGAVVFILYQQGYLAKMLQSSASSGEYEETGNSRFLPQVVPAKPGAAKPASGTQVASAATGAKPSIAPVSTTPIIKPVKAIPIPPKPAMIPAPPVAPVAPPPLKPASLVNVPPVRVKPPPAPVAPVAPAATAPGGAKPGAPKVATAPLEPPVTSQSVLKGKDPFYIPGSNAPVKVASIRRLSVPALNIVRFRAPAPSAVIDPNAGGGFAGAPSDQQGAGGRRVSGIMYSNGVYALLEANGQTYTVQPGDQVEGDRVISIQSDGLMLRTANNVLVHVPLNGGGGAASGGAAPGGFTPTQSGGPPPGARF